MAKNGLFYEDQAKRLKNPKLAAESKRFAQQIKTVDAIVNMLEAQLESASLTKAELARRLDMESANIRRLFTSSTNPTIATISDIAFELGLELQLVPIVKTTRSHGINLVRTRMTPMRDSRTPRKAIPANA